MGKTFGPARGVSGAPEDDGREILFEFVQLGGQVRVAALDAVTGAEAVIIGPANAARADLERVAIRKLMRLLSGRSDDQGEDPPAGPGWVV